MTARGEGPLRPAAAVLGIVSMLLGLLWIGQGGGLIGGSFMTGSQTWLAIGVLCLTGGAFGLFLAFRRSDRSSGSA